MKLAIMAAMPDEVYTIHNAIHFHKKESRGERTYYFARHENIDVILVYSRCGKVSASSTATTLIEKYQVDHIIFTGVAGAVNENLNIGDIVLGEKSYQHDMDARPIFPRFEIPLTGYSIIKCNDEDIKIASLAIQNFIANIKNYVNADALKKFSIKQPKLSIGTIATGDQFIRDPMQHDGLKLANENILAVEMEGAAVAQVCHEYKVRYLIVRTISDRADHSAGIDFQTFITEVASHYSSGIVREIFKLIPHSF